MNHKAKKNPHFYPSSLQRIKTIFSSFKHKTREIRNQTVAMQENISKYTKKNPLKALGLGALFGALITKIFNRSK